MVCLTFRLTEYRIYGLQQNGINKENRKEILNKTWRNKFQFCFDFSHCKWGEEPWLNVPIFSGIFKSENLIEVGLKVRVRVKFRVKFRFSFRAEFRVRF